MISTLELVEETRKPKKIMFPDTLRTLQKIVQTEIRYSEETGYNEP